MKLSNRKCPQCGGESKFSEEEKCYICGCCGSRLYLEADQTIEIRDNQDHFKNGKLFQEGMYAAQDERNKQLYNNAYQNPGVNSAPRKNKSTSGCIVALLTFFLLLGVGFVFLIIGTILSRKNANNPAFESGVNTTERYAESIDEITDEMINELYENASDIYTATLTHGEVINSIKYEGIYFLTPKTADTNPYSTSANNDIYIILNVNITNDKGDTYEETFDYYWYVKYSDIVVREDGSNEIYNITDYSYPTSSYNPSNHWLNLYLKGGFDTLEDLYNKTIRPLGMEYNIGSNIGSDTGVTESEQSLASLG